MGSFKGYGGVAWSSRGRVIVAKEQGKRDESSGFGGTPTSLTSFNEFFARGPGGFGGRANGRQIGSKRTPFQGAMNVKIFPGGRQFLGRDNVGRFLRYCFYKWVSMSRLFNKYGGSRGGQSFLFIVFAPRGCVCFLGPRPFS